MAHSHTPTRRFFSLSSIALPAALDTGTSTCPKARGRRYCVHLGRYDAHGNFVSSFRARHRLASRRCTPRPVRPAMVGQRGASAPCTCAPHGASPAATALVGPARSAAASPRAWRLKVCARLHAHSAVRAPSEYDRFLEEDWFFEALTGDLPAAAGCVRGAVRDGIPFRMTMSLTPPLLSMMTDPQSAERYVRYLDERLEALAQWSAAAPATRSLLPPRRVLQRALRTPGAYVFTRRTVAT